MRKALLAGVIALGAIASTSHAATVTVTGQAVEIGVPTDVNNTSPGDNKNILWFKESVNSLVIADQAGLGGTGIKKGDLVDTYIIFLNRADGLRTLVEATANFAFGTKILGVFGNEVQGQTDPNQDLKATDYLGSGISYTNFRNRGIENNSNGSLTAGTGDDTLGLSADMKELSVFFRVTQPGDWIRVATVAAVPLPAGALLLPFGLAGLAYVGRRKRKASAA